MTDITIGIVTSAVIILFLEIFRSVDKRLIGSFTLAVIPFIYIGFAWKEFPALAVVIAAAALFLFLAYYGFKKDYRAISVGLILHGVWDMIFPNYTPVVPAGYDLFCLTADVLLAAYFYYRIRPLTN